MTTFLVSIEFFLLMFHVCKHMQFDRNAVLQMLPGQFLRIGWKMVMLGDETWIKLFPGLFMRHDGVSSFFVSFCVIVYFLFMSNRIFPIRMMVI